MKAHEDARVRVLQVTIPAPRDAVFAFLADIENLPRWAERFCAQLEISAHGWHAWTSFGDLFVELEANEHVGVIDLRFGTECEPLADVPLRVWARPDGGTLVGGWLVQAAGQDDASFARQASELADALASLPTHWPARAQRLCA
jgi:hypothetical protein